ncbi:MAG TPA: hypothetical protein ENK49_08570 [Gammaproteobacteria bacterium]|nr:hypothetical protein [Gammaproteobacteria bacterium]
MIVSQTEFAELVGYSPRQVLNWIKAGMPCESSGRQGRKAKIDTAKAIRWLLSRKAEKQETGLSKDRQRLLKAQARRIELETAEREGALIEFEVVQQIMRESMQIVAAGMDSLPGRLASQLATMTEPGEIRALLLRELRNVRRQGADQMEALAGGTEPQTGTGG